MTIIENLNLLIDTKNQISSAIIYKTGLDNLNEYSFSDYPGLISGIQGGGGDSLFKVVDVIKYQPAISAAYTITSGIAVTGFTYDPEYDMEDYTTYNGDYLPTNATKNEQDPLKRVYKHVSYNHYIYVYDDREDYNYTGELNWCLGYSADSFGEFYAAATAGETVPVNGWNTYMAMTSNTPQLTIGNETVPARPQIFAYKEAIDYDIALETFTLSNTSGSFDSFDYTPLENQTYTMFSGHLIGQPISYVGIPDSTMEVLNGHTKIFEFGSRNYYKANDGWSVCAYANMNGWKLPYLVGKTSEAARVGGQDSTDTGNPKSFIYRDGKAYWVSGDENALGNNTQIDYTYPNMKNAGTFGAYSNEYSKLGWTILDFYFGYNE